MKIWTMRTLSEDVTGYYLVFSDTHGEPENDKIAERLTA